MNETGRANRAQDICSKYEHNASPTMIGIISTKVDKTSKKWDKGQLAIGMAIPLIL